MDLSESISATYELIKKLEGFTIINGLSGRQLATAEIQYLEKISVTYTSCTAALFDLRLILSIFGTRKETDLFDAMFSNFRSLQPLGPKTTENMLIQFINITRSCPTVKQLGFEYQSFPVDLSSETANGRKIIQLVWGANSFVLYEEYEIMQRLINDDANNLYEKILPPLINRVCDTAVQSFKTDNSIEITKEDMCLVHNDIYNDMLYYGGLINENRSKPCDLSAILGEPSQHLIKAFNGIITNEFKAYIKSRTAKSLCS